MGDKKTCQLTTMLLERTNTTTYDKKMLKMKKILHHQ